jgi:histone deacetylase 11
MIVMTSLPSPPIISPGIPIVYSPRYNIHFFGLETLLHSFDSKKYGRIFQMLGQKFGLTLQDVYQPEPLAPKLLELVHTPKYLASLEQSAVAARVAEVPPLALLPNFLIQARLLEPMRLATSGTLLAADLALQRGWAINLSGGYHHAKPNKGEGFCFFADIPLTLHILFQHASAPIHKALIVDLDAHQGNGYSTCFAYKDFTTEQSPSDLAREVEDRNELVYVKDSRIHVYDIYNQDIYPNDHFAQNFITYNHPVRSNINDTAYLSLLRRTLPAALDASRPDLLVYNAGTDIFELDPLGHMKITAQGIIERDEFVFHECRQRRIPVLMVLSGGYTKQSASIIADSIANLHEQGLISLHRLATTGAT